MTEQKPSGMFSWLKSYGQRLANNIDPLNLYARLKDYYKGIEIAVPWIADWVTKSSIEKSQKSTFSRDDLDNPNKSKEALWQLLEGSQSKSSMNKLKTGVAGDTAFTGVMGILSTFSGWAEKSQVQRVYGKLAEIEFSKSEANISFSDLKKSKNPMLREAAEYYGKKSLIRSGTDLFGLVRWFPLLAYGAQDKFGKPENESSKLINNKDKGAGKLLNGMANFGDGIKLLMFAKTFFFQWYFSSRQTGSFYESKNIWNMTEGVSSAPNRALNENVDSGEFVTRQHITKLYQRFREENMDMNLQEFTPDDPLASRIFEQTSRYLNHTYMPKLYAISEPAKQYDLPRKRLTHAMLTELVGTGGLRVEDAIGSVLRLETLAYHGQNGVENGIAKYREISTVLDKVVRPERQKFTTQDEAVEAVHSYLKQIDKIGREYLGEYWPPKYVNEELKEGYIKTVFQGTEISQEKIDYMASALFMREESKETKYTPHDRDPASALLDTPQENAVEEKRAAAHRPKSFTENISRKRVEDVMKSQTEEQPAAEAQTVR